MGDMADYQTQGLFYNPTPGEIAYYEVDKLAKKFERKANKKDRQVSTGTLPWNDTTGDEWRQAAKETRALANRLIKKL